MPIQYGLLTREHLEALTPILPEVRQAADENNVYAVGAVKDDCLCGVLVFHADGELLIDIQYIAVAEAYQRQGIADGLIDFLCKSAWESATAICCTFAATDENEPLYRLFVRRGDFTLAEEEGYICRFPCKELSRVELSAAPPAGTRIAAFYDLPERAQRRFVKEMKKDSPELAAGIFTERGQMLRPLCLCVVDAAENVRAAIFCQGRGHDVELSLACAAPGHARALAALAGCLRELLLGAGERASYLWIAAVTPQSRKLIDKLLPVREVTEKFYTACWDMNTMGGRDDVHE